MEIQGEAGRRGGNAPLGGASRPVKLLLLFGAFFVGLCITSVIGEAGAAMLGAGSRAALLFTSAVQSVVAFILPAWVCYRLISPDPLTRLGVKRGYTLAALLLTLAVMAAATPAMNEIIHLNESMRFGKTVDALFRLWEGEAKRLTDVMLLTQSVGGLVAGVLIVGALTGFAEELFFRGALQPMLKGSGVNATGAVWIAAIVFSLMHFQPYGFVPRLLLGAFFGYLYMWSGSIWLPATAHAVNNSLVVVTAWLTTRGADVSGMEQAGVAEGGFPWIAALSAVATGVLIAIAYRWIRRPAKASKQEPQ